METDEKSPSVGVRIPVGAIKQEKQWLPEDLHAPDKKFQEFVQDPNQFMKTEIEAEADAVQQVTPITRTTNAYTEQAEPELILNKKFLDATNNSYSTVSAQTNQQLVLVRADDQQAGVGIAHENTELCHNIYSEQSIDAPNCIIKSELMLSDEFLDANSDCDSASCSQENYSLLLKTGDDPQARVSLPGTDSKKCELCNDVFPKESLDTHIKEVHSKYTYQCKLCALFFEKKSHLTRHSRNHDNNLLGNYEYTCEQCGSKFPYKQMEQRSCIKFCVKNKIRCSEVVRMLCVAFGDSTLCEKNIYKWYKQFEEGREDVNDNPRPGRPSSSTTDENVEAVKKMILENRRITIREAAEEVGISVGACHAIFSDVLGMRRVSGKLVPKLLNVDQKSCRISISQESLNEVDDDPDLLKRIITGDETWVYGYDVEIKAESSQWKRPEEPRPKKARQVRSHVKVLLTVFFDYYGVVHHEFLPQDTTVSKEYYLQVMRRLCEAIKSKRPVLWENKSWLLHHDNAPAHTSLLVRNFLANNNTIMMPQPPYSPDLAPCDFFLFPKLKSTLKGQTFSTIEQIKTESLEKLKAIPKTAYEKCFKDLKKRWHKCIISDGDYFEGTT